MIHEIGLARANFGKVETVMGRKRGRLNKLAIFPMTSGRGHFADVDLWVKIGRKGLSMVAAIAIQDIKLAHGFELMLAQPHGENRGDTRVKTAAKQGHQACLLETLLIVPLPFILEFRLILWLVIGSVEIMHTGL